MLMSYNLLVESDSSVLSQSVNFWCTYDRLCSTIIRIIFVGEVDLSWILHSCHKLLLLLSTFNGVKHSDLDV